MNKWVAAVVIGVIAATFALDADAQRRFGGGRNLGRQSPQVQQRQATPPAQSPQAAPAQPGAQQAAPTQSTGRRCSSGGTASGQSVARRADGARRRPRHRCARLVARSRRDADDVPHGAADRHGADAARTLRRCGAMRPTPAPAGAGRGPGTYSNVGYETSPAPVPVPVQRASVTPQAAGARPGSAMDQFTRGGANSAPWGVPAGFDTAQFLAHAKEHYARLQRAWDSRNLDEMAEFTTNDMFIALTHELHDRPGTDPHRGRVARRRVAGHRVRRQ